MARELVKRLSPVVFLVLFNFFFTQSKAQASTLTNLSDTITTSRPSAASPLSSNATNITSLSIVNNGSRYLASDSAKIMRTSTGADITTGLVVASQSAALTTVYFTAVTGSNGQGGTDVLITNQTAMHTVSFINAQPIPSGGKIIITFPGSAQTSASPSATTFSFNGLTTGNAATNIQTNNATTCSWNVTAPAITCTTNALINTGTIITFLIGCTAATGPACTAQSPRLINPTKTAAAGTADTWGVALKTQDAGSLDLDTGTTKIGTVETVTVQATVDSSFTFTIAGVANGVAARTGNLTGCANTENTSSAFDASATVVNLGALPVLGSVAPNISAQLITITSNGVDGYSLTATSSGHLSNDANGFAITDSTTPAAFPSLTPWFGISACGADVSAFGSGATARGSGRLYAWPTKTTVVTLASDSTGPIAGSGGNGLTTVEYAAAVDTSVPAGNYTSEITYVATPVF